MELMEPAKIIQAELGEPIITPYHNRMWETEKPFMVLLIGSKPP